jgi:hypothetical protein
MMNNRITLIVNVVGRHMRCSYVGREISDEAVLGFFEPISWRLIGCSEDIRQTRGLIMSCRGSKLESLECQADGLPLEVTCWIIK